jgi:translation initiation factor 1A
MTRNHHGGKSHRKSKSFNDNDEKRQLEYKEDGQEYALITKVLGNSRFECMCSDGRTRLGHVRGKLQKKVWINLYDTVLVSLRDYQDDKSDIIHKYTREEVRVLVAYKEINESLTASTASENLNKEDNAVDDDTGIDFEDI